MKRLYLLFLLLSLMSTAAFAQRVALRTDLLLWGTTTPNAGVETSISRHFTVALNGAYNAWKFGNDMKLNLYFVQPELRYWPCTGAFIATLRSANAVAPNAKYQIILPLNMARAQRKPFQIVLSPNKNSRPAGCRAGEESFLGVSANSRGGQTSEESVCVFT